ncbi:MAG TPA: ABC transporter permease [Acidobacteriaceae bacterium]|jgi:predicted permease|nr:ABC transporter permease [Acidobacteriaceae bacterium]
MHDLWTDLRIATRRLRRSPGFVVVAVLSLTMAIAANLVVFGVMNAAILRPLPMVAHADRLETIEHKQQGYLSQSYPDYRDIRAGNTTFSDMAAFRIDEIALNTDGQAKTSWAYEVTGSYFDLLGLQPELGQFFHASDEHGPNSAPFVVLSDGFWRSRFGGDPRVIGRIANLNKHPFTVIGVAPAGFHGTELFLWPDFYMPMMNEEQINGYSYLNERHSHGIFAIGLLKPGVSPEQGTADLNRIAVQMQKQNPTDDDQLGFRLVKPGWFGDQLGPATRGFLAGLLLLAALVLAAACVNLASIFAARAADRGRELAIRVAIGSSRWRVLRQVLAEAALLSVAGGVAGVMGASALLQVLSQWSPIATLPIRLTVTADARVYGLAVLLAGASGILPALLTARQIWRTDAMQAMKGTVQPVLRRLSVRDGLLGLQVALCALLVTCALVGLRGMNRELHAPLGFEPQGAMLVETEMKMAGYSDASALPVQKRMLEAAAQIPGVNAVGTMDEPPLNAGGSTTPVYRQGTTDFRNSNSVTVAKFFTISPGWLQAAGTRLIAGRDFTWHDDKQAPHVALVNETFARQMFGSVPAAIGAHFAEPGPTKYEVIGVVENGKYGSLTEEPTPAMFWPLGQNNENDTTLVVRSTRTPAEMAAALQTMMQKIDPSLPVTIESWPRSLDLALFPARVATIALGVLGLLAGMLAATGIFGMASYTVARRLREMGIRVALGAQRKQVLRAALGRTVLLLGGGSVAGLALGILGSRLLANVVYEATVYDPVVLAGAIVAMIAIGSIAAAVPARRAVSVEPAVLLREE